MVLELKAWTMGLMMNDHQHGAVQTSHGVGVSEAL